MPVVTGSDATFAVANVICDVKKDIIATIERNSYKKETKNNVSDKAFNGFFVRNGENIGTLSAFYQREDSLFNVYWLRLEKASQYTVEVYKSYGGELYHLRNYPSDRNEGFVIIDGLVGHGYIFRVLAEDRNGQVLARVAVR